MRIPLFFFISLLFSFNTKISIGPNEYIYVPNKETAIKIAEAVWLPIYGKNIYNSLPFIASINGDSSIWHVYGTLPQSGYKVNSYGDTTIMAVRGGVPNAFINRKDGKILNIYHSK